MLDPLSQFFWFGLYAVAIFISAVNAKALGASIVYAISISAVYPSTSQAGGLMLLYVVATVLASFRD